VPCAGDFGSLRTRCKFLKIRRHRRTVGMCIQVRAGFKLLAMVCLLSQPSLAETALEVQSWCKRTVEAPVLADRRVKVGNTFNDGFCWGAFAAIQDLTRIATPENERLLNICSPSNSTRLVMIKVFMRYADQHPRELVDDFTFVARRALVEAFPCDATN
jgi:Rap1a immunity proteins